MSGIFGILNLGNFIGKPVSLSDLQSMGQALKHRGRDGSGFWHEGDVGLGHLATNITPESVYEKLPCTSADGRLVITADARIDNRQELFSSLSIPYSQQVQIACSEIILHSFQKWGERCPEHLLGEFVFAIWDKREKRLFCARDHLGVRPFFYYHASNLFVFASEIKAIRALDVVPLRFNEAALGMKTHPGDRLEFRETFFKDIMRLKAANGLALHTTTNNCSTHSYWNPEDAKPVRYSKDSSYAEALRELTIQSVHNHVRLLPHLDAAVALSGGLDSSAIACIAARKLGESGKRLVAVSSVLPGDHSGIETDERHYIREVLEQEPNIDIHYVTGEDSGPLDWPEMEAGIREMEEPASAFHHMDRALCKAARDSGAHLMLWGLGGDFLSSYDGRDSLFWLVKTWQWSKAFRLIQQLQQVERIPAFKLVKRFILAPFAPEWLFNIHQRIIHGNRNPKGEETSPFTLDFVSQYRDVPGNQKIRPGRPSAIPHEGFIKKHRAGRFLIEKENIRQSHYGLKAGFPCWDKRIVEFVMGVPPEQFLLGGWKRSLFRRAMEGILPPAIQWRRDKHVYIPDFHRRVMMAGPEILNFLYSIKDEEYLHRYIDIRRIKNQLDRIRPVQGRKDWETATQTVVMNGLIFIKFLQWMNHEITASNKALTP